MAYVFLEAKFKLKFQAPLREVYFEIWNCALVSLGKS